MSEALPEVQHRLYPIGAFREEEVLEILADPSCIEDISADELIDQWRSKSRAFEARAPTSLDVLDSELLPLAVKQETRDRIESVLASYRHYLPDSYDLAFLPTQKLISPQWSIIYEHAHGSPDGAVVGGPLSDDENASLCIGSPVHTRPIEATYLGSPKITPAPNRFDYLFQFSSDDPNVRYIPMMPAEPVRDVNLALEDAPFPYEVKAVPVAVGLGLPFVHVFKVPTGLDPATGSTVYRLIVFNGIHRIFKLAELGNTHVAAMVQTLRYENMPNRFIDSPKERLFVPRPLTVSAMTDGSVSRLFKWRLRKRIIKLHVTVTQEISYTA